MLPHGTVPVGALPSQELAFEGKMSYINRAQVSDHFSSMVLGWESAVAIV